MAAVLPSLRTSSMWAGPGRGAHCGSGGIRSTGHTGPNTTVPSIPDAPDPGLVVAGRGAKVTETTVVAEGRDDVGVVEDEFSADVVLVAPADDEVAAGRPEASPQPATIATAQMAMTQRVATLATMGESRRRELTVSTMPRTSSADCELRERHPVSGNRRSPGNELCNTRPSGVVTIRSPLALSSALHLGRCNRW